MENVSNTSSLNPLNRLKTDFTRLFLVRSGTLLRGSKIEDPPHETIYCNILFHCYRYLGNTRVKLKA